MMETRSIGDAITLVLFTKASMCQLKLCVMCIGLRMYYYYY